MNTDDKNEITTILKTFTERDFHVLNDSRLGSIIKKFRNQLPEQFVELNDSYLKKKQTSDFLAIRALK